MKKKNYLLLIAFSLMVLTNSFTLAQSPPAKQWDARFGGKANDALFFVQQTTDLGYILGGHSRSGPTGDKTQNSRGGWDQWIVKTNASGVKQWDARFGGTGDDYITGGSQTTDGGYIFGGGSSSGISGDRTQASWGSEDYWIVKTDANGVKQWDKRFGGLGYDDLRAIRQTTDGGYIMAGESYSSNSGDKTGTNQGTNDFWIVKTDMNGVKQWDKTFGGSLGETPQVIQQTSDGGYIVGGWSQSNISGDKTENARGGFDYWIVKMDALGVKQWDKTFGGSGQEELQWLQQTSDDGYILGGGSDSDISGDKTQASQGGMDYWIVKIDALGAKQWDKTFGGSGLERFNSLQQTTDGGYILGGGSGSGISGDKTQSSQGEFDQWIVKTDANGVKQWDGRYGGNRQDLLHSLQQTSDGGYILAGSSDSDISGDKTQARWDPFHSAHLDHDYWMVKLGALGMLTWYQDADGDNYWGTSQQSASQPAGLGWSTSQELGGPDCDDNDINIHACPLTWTGAVSNQWKTVGNWQPQKEPTATDDVIIPASASVFPVSSATNVCHHLTIETGASLTMTGGVLSVYGSVNAPVKTCLDLQAGTLKLYTGSTFPPDMDFNNLSIYMNPSSTDEVDNTYVFPGLNIIHGNLTMNGTGDLPKINKNLNEGFYLDGNLTINGGLIGMATPPADLSQSALPYIGLTGASTQNIKINNNTLHTLDHSLIINNPNVVLQSTLISVYHLVIQSNFNTQGKNIRIRGNCSVNSGNTLTMTDGNVSIYGTITAPAANCFDLQGGTLKLYHGSTLPVDMDFNNLSIYMNPSSSAEADNTYIFPGLNMIHGNLTMTGTGYLPKINKNLDEGFYLDGNLTINGGLIGMDGIPGSGLQDHLPYLGLTGTSIQNIKINNDTPFNALDHNLIIDNPNVVLQSDFLSVYNLALQKNLDIKGKSLDIVGKIVYTGTSVITNSVPYSGDIIIENIIPLDDQPLSLKIDNARSITADASALNDNIYLDGNLQVLQLQISNGALDLMGHDLTVGRTTSSLGFFNVAGYIFNSDPSGTFSLLGNSSCQIYQLTGGSFFNFTLNSPNGVEIDNNILPDAVIINGTATLTKGSFDVKDHNVYMGVDVGNISETAGNIFYSTLPATSGGVFVKSTFNSGVNNLNINGSGFIVTSTNPLHEIEISRYCRKETGSPLQTFIYRLFQVKNDGGGTGLGAKIKLKYDEFDLSGVNESDLWILRKKSTGTTWTILNSTVNTSAKTVTTTGTYSKIDTSNPSDPDDYTMYTLGDVNNALRNGITIDGKTEQVVLEENQLLVFPNPAKDRLEIRTASKSSQSTLQVLNINGTEMMNKTIVSDEEGNYSESLDISTLPIGMYILSIVNESSSEAIKFVKE